MLRLKALPVPKKDIGSPGLLKTLKKMHAALAPEEYGVAIAAPQIGESLRIFVVAGRVFMEPQEEGAEKQKVPPNRVYINPEITRASRKKKDESEGCLSVRAIYGTVARHERVSLRALNEKGEVVIENASGLLAQIFQHEVDHLQGILFIDKAKDLHESK